MPTQIDYRNVDTSLIKVYVSGPISTGDRTKNIEAGIDITRELIEHRFAVFTPHLSHYVDSDDKYGYDYWLANDFAWILSCDAILRIPGESPGGDAEVAFADLVGVPVFFEIDKLVAAANDGFFAEEQNQKLSRSLRQYGGDPRFLDLVEEMAALHAMKQSDYGLGHDPFANVRASEEFGVPAWVGALIRMNDKVTRLKSFAQKGSLANESAEDSMKDISVYALIALILYREAAESTM